MAQEFATKRVVKYTFAFGGTDNLGVSNNTQTAKNTGIFFPVGAIITGAYANVTTGFTAASAIAIGVTGSTTAFRAAATANTAPAINAAACKAFLPSSGGAIASATDTAIVREDATAGQWVVISSTPKEMIITVSASDILAGSMDIYVEYVV